MVMGRTTYVEMAAIVASQDDPSFARMAELPKIVFSSTLEDKDLTWANTTLVRDEAHQRSRSSRRSPATRCA